MTLKILNIATFFLTALLLQSQMYAADSYVSQKLIPSVRMEGSYEIGEINFSGNKAFDSDFLHGIISLKPTSRSFPHKVLQAYYNESKKNRAAPRILMKHINIAIKSLEHEIKYFDQTSAETDTLALWHFYNTQGFHNVSINFRFVPNFRKRINVLTFYINEGEQFLLDTVVCRGIEQVADDVRKNLLRIQKRYR